MVKIENITKNYIFNDLSKNILDMFSYDMPESGIVGIIGSSGCGKTTLINIIAGIIKYDSGSINGTENKKISYMFQEDRLLPWVSGLDNILAVNSDRSECLDIINSVGLKGEENKKPNDLSGGMRQRMALARSLAYHCDIYLMDEPFKEVDIALKKSLVELVRVKTKGKLCIFVTHDIEEAAVLSDIVLVTKGMPLKIVKEIFCSGKSNNDIESEIKSGVLIDA